MQRLRTKQHSARAEAEAAAASLVVRPEQAARGQRPENLQPELHHSLLTDSKLELLSLSLVVDRRHSTAIAAELAGAAILADNQANDRARATARCKAADGADTAEPNAVVAAADRRVKLAQSQRPAFAGQAERRAAASVGMRGCLPAHRCRR